MFFIFTQNQTQYWAREIKAKIISDSDNTFDKLHEIVSLGYCPVVEVLKFEKEFFSFPPNSLIALLNTDEKYDSEINSLVLNCDAFKAIIRPYRISDANILLIFNALLAGFLEGAKSFSVQTPRKLVGWCIEGMGMFKRQLRIRIETKYSGKTIINIPLGYTDFFAETFLGNLERVQHKEVSESDSLLEFAILANTQPSYRTYRFVFIGQIGQIVRQYAINALQKFDSKKLVVRNGYGGVSNDENRKLKIGEEYVNGLIESHISVCPPGNISGNSYRIMESLICGSYPAVMSNVLCDPLFESPVIEVLRGRKPFTWYRYLKRLDKVPSAELQQKVVENLHKFREEISVVNLQIEALQARN